MTDFSDYLMTSSLRLGKINLVPSTQAVCIFFKLEGRGLLRCSLKDARQSERNRKKCG